MSSKYQAPRTKIVNDAVTSQSKSVDSLRVKIQIGATEHSELNYWENFPDFINFLFN